MSRKAVVVASPDVRRCAIYTRKSTTMGLEQDFNSLDAQRESCLAYVRRQMGWTVIDEQYDDGGFTGANIERPAFQRLMADVESGKIDIILVYKVDRLSRSLLDFAKVMERLNAAGTSFVSVTQNFSTADAMGRLTLNMLMSFAEFEREMIGERTRDKIAASRRKGKWTGGPVPFGYAAKDKKLVVNEGEAAIVREAYRVFLDHGRVAQTARDLTANGLLPRRASWGRPDKELRWTKDSLSRLLENPLYAGIITCGEDSVDGEHEAIIEREQWERTQRVLRGRVRGVNCHGVNPDYVLRGLLRCGKCGEAMCPASTRKGNKVHRYYRCMTRDKFGKACCGAAPLAAGALETYVVERVAEWAGRHDLTQECHARFVPLLVQRKELLESQRHHLAERLGEANARCGKFADEWVNAEGAVKGILRQRVDATTTELEQLKQAAADVTRQLAEVAERQYDLEWVARALSNFRTLWAAMTSVNRGRLMRGLLEKIIVHEATGKVEIHFADFEAGLEATTATVAA